MNLEKWKWPITVLLVVAAALWVAVVGFGEQLGIHEDLRQQVTGAVGGLTTVLLIPLFHRLTAMVIKAATKDSDGDGVPDWADPDSETTADERVPKSTIIPPLVVLLFVGLASGCSTPQSMVLAGDIMTTVREGIDLGGEIVGAEGECSTERVQAADDVQATAVRCQRARDSHDALRASYKVASVGLIDSLDGGTFNLARGVPYIIPLVELYESWRQVGAGFGRSMPTAREQLSDLLELLR